MEKIKEKIGLILAIFIFAALFIFINAPKPNIELESPPGVIFTKENLFFYVPGREDEPRWTPSKNDVKKAEEILATCTGKEHPKIYKKLSQYKRQYVGVINEYGRKILYINAFVDRGNEFSEWKDYQVDVKDGGDDFFNVNIDLGNESCFYFMVHWPYEP